MMRLLITAANSDISINVARIVRSFFPDACLVGVAPDGNLPATFYFDHFETIPLVSQNEHYMDKLEKVLKKHKIDILCPIAEREIDFFARRKYFPIPNVLINNPDLVDKCLDKYETYNWLKDIQVPVPESLLFKDHLEISYPVVIKPRSSAGSKNMFYVNNVSLFNALKETYAHSSDQYIVQREIGTINDEYTCALWRFKEDFRFLILQRKLQGGLTGEAKVVENAAISEALHKIKANIHGDFFINVQLRMEGERAYVLEINPRFSSTIMMRNKIGFQDVIWSLLASLEYEIPCYITPNTGTRIFRVADELVVEV